MKSKYGHENTLKNTEMGYAIYTRQKVHEGDYSVSKAAHKT